MKEHPLPFDTRLPWEGPFEDYDDTPLLPELAEDHGREPEDPSGGMVGLDSVSRLLDQIVMDIQHLEIELVRARYRLSSYLEPPFDEYMRMELFGSMGGRYGGDQVYDRYLRHRGFKEDDDAIDTPFHVARMLRLAQGQDDYPDLYP